MSKPEIENDLWQPRTKAERLAYGLALAGASLVFLGACMVIVHLAIQANGGM